MDEIVNTNIKKASHMQFEARSEIQSNGLIRAPEIDIIAGVEFKNKFSKVNFFKIKKHI